MENDLVIYEKEIKRMIIEVWTLLLFPFVFGTFGYLIVKNTTFHNAFLLTVETISFLHPREVGMAFVIQVFLVIFGLVAVSTAIAELMTFSIEGKFQRYFTEVNNMKKIKNLKNHVIICGAGTIGLNVAEGLKKLGKNFIILEKNHNLASSLLKKGYEVIELDAVKISSLNASGLKNAKSLILTMGEVEKNVTASLSARMLSKKVVIYSRSKSADDDLLLKKAGVDFIISPEVSGAEYILKKLSKN